VKIPDHFKPLDLGLHVAGVAVPGYFAVKGYRDRVKSGQNPAFAAVLETAANFAPFLFSLPAQLAWFYGIPATRAMTSAIIGQAREQNQMVRMARTPFSHRFEHSDVTARAQALGLQSIGSAWGHARMGSEAAMMARRYGR
jgi:hypothetical protein